MGQAHSREQGVYVCVGCQDLELVPKVLMQTRQASSDKKQLDVGANLFIGNLDENVDERLLYDTFSAFGMLSTTAKVRTLFYILASNASLGSFPVSCAAEAIGLRCL